MSSFIVLPVALSFIPAHVSPPVPSAPSQARRADFPQPPASKAKCAQVRFTGEATRDQIYFHALPGNLEFRLLPFPEGWSLFIGRPGDKTEDYLGIATPPYHGINPDVIEAWHFRNADNTGPNEGQVEAPGNIRDFSFVLSEAAYKKFSGALNIWSGGKPDATEKQRVDATNFLLNAPRRSGTLTIQEMKLGGLEKGVRPWFESLKFKVDLCFPLPAAPSPDENGSAKLPLPKKSP